MRDAASLPEPSILAGIPQVCGPWSLALVLAFEIGTVLGPLSDPWGKPRELHI